jgi:hypothetical protein
VTFCGADWESPMELEALIPLITTRLPFPQVMNSIQATLPQLLSHPLTFRLFRVNDRPVVDLYFIFSFQPGATR